MSSPMITFRVVEAPMSELLSQLQRTRPRESSTADVALMCRDGYVPAHSAVLKLASSFLADILTDHFKQNNRSAATILLPDFKVDVVRKVIQLLYCGFAYVNIQISEDIKMDEVKEVMQAFKMTDNSAFTFAELAENEEMEDHLPILYYSRDQKIEAEMKRSLKGDTHDDDSNADEYERFRVVQEVKLEEVIIEDWPETATEDEDEDQVNGNGKGDSNTDRSTDEVDTDMEVISATPKAKMKVVEVYDLMNESEDAESKPSDEEGSGGDSPPSSVNANPAKQKKDTEKKNTKGSNQQPTSKSKGRQGKQNTEEEEEGEKGKEDGSEQEFATPPSSPSSSPLVRRSLRPRSPLKTKAQRNLPKRIADESRSSSEQIYTSESSESEPESDTGDGSDEGMTRRRKTKTFRSKRTAAAAAKKAPPGRAKVTLPPPRSQQTMAAKAQARARGEAPKRNEEPAKKRSGTVRGAAAAGNSRKKCTIGSDSDDDDRNNEDNDKDNENDEEYVSGDGDNDDSDYANRKHAQFMDAAKKCNKCGKTYESPKEASVCVTEKHGMVRCYYCFKVLENTEKLFDHYKNSHKKAGKESHLLCKFCQQAVSFKSVSTHVISYHLFNKTKKPEPPTSSTVGAGRPGRPPTITTATANVNAKTNSTPTANKRKPAETSSESEDESDDDEGLMGGGKLVVKKNTSSGKKKYKMGLSR